MTNMSQNGDSRSPSTKPQLQHCFMAGLRFDTEVEYLDQEGRWKPLHVEPDETSIRTTADQANTSLLQHINELLHKSPQTLHDTMQEWQEWLDEAGGQYQARMIQGPVHTLAQPLLKGLSSEGVILVQLALPKDGKRWMLVAGVECEHSAFEPVKLRRLLVLDPLVPALWGCGHNVRVTLPSKSQSDSTALQNKLCIYRTLDGGYLACTVQRMVVIQARA